MRSGRRETLTDISKETGLSIATVSRVLNNSPLVSPDTRNTVLKALNGRRGLKKANRGATIGISLYDFHSDRLNHMYVQDVIGGVLQSARVHDFTIRPVDLVAERGEGETFPQLLMRLDLSGLIHIGPDDRLLPAVRTVADAGFPQCLVASRMDHPNVSWIGTENIESTKKAVEYLINLGHRRIGIVTPGDVNEDHRERLEGYRRALADAGLEADPKLHASCRNVTLRMGISTMMELLAQPERPTAVYFTNAELALGGVRACYLSRLRVPDDVSIITFSDSIFTEYVTPPLALVRQPVFEMGRLAGQCVAGQIKHRGSETVRELIVPDFIVNDSAGPAKNL